MNKEILIAILIGISPAIAFFIVKFGTLGFYQAKKFIEKKEKIKP
jgi:hypothetical protein